MVERALFLETESSYTPTNSTPEACNAWTAADLAEMPDTGAPQSLSQQWARAFFLPSSQQKLIRGLWSVDTQRYEVVMARSFRAKSGKKIDASGISQFLLISFEGGLLSPRRPQCQCFLRSSLVPNIGPPGLV